MPKISYSSQYCVEILRLGFSCLPWSGIQLHLGKVPGQQGAELLQPPSGHLPRVLPDLEGGTSSLEGRVSLSLTLAQLLRLGLHFGYKGLRAFLTVKGAHDRARKRKAV